MRWEDNLEAWNGKALATGDSYLVIETDASRKGWGAFCMGISTGCLWSNQGKKLHINCLELLPGAFAVKVFARNKIQMKIRLLMDNVSAAHYINKMGWGGGGGTKFPVLAQLTSPEHFSITMIGSCLQLFSTL